LVFSGLGVAVGIDFYIFLILAIAGYILPDIWLWLPMELQYTFIYIVEVISCNWQLLLLALAGTMAFAAGDKGCFIQPTIHSYVGVFYCKRAGYKESRLQRNLEHHPSGMYAGAAGQPGF